MSRFHAKGVTSSAGAQVIEIHVRNAPDGIVENGPAQHELGHPSERRKPMNGVPPPITPAVGLAGTSLLCSPIEPVTIAVAIVIAVLPV